MASIKKYFQNQCQSSMFNLQHYDLSDFYLSVFQRSRSPLPLLCLRTFLFLGCLGILLTSTIMTAQLTNFKYWPIFLTHWGVILITITTACGALVSLKAYLEGPLDVSNSLLLYAQWYWVFYNISIPLAFVITIFYWAVLIGAEEDYAVDAVLDLFIHAVNSVVMLVLLVSSRQPSRLLHFIHPLALCITYLVFSVIYYFAGGLNPLGDPYIYPMLDWSKPGEAIVTVVGTATLLIFAHAVFVLLSLGRDKLRKRVWKNSNSVDIYNNAYN